MLTAADYQAIVELKRRAETFPCVHPNQPPERMAAHSVQLSNGVRLLLTLDLDHWFPNQDWQRCWHSSLSALDNGGQPVEPDRERQKEVLQAIFPAPMLSLLCHEHRPGSLVHHWRLFFDEHGQAVVPKGEMYTRRGTESYFRVREKAKACAAVRNYQPEEGR